MKKILVTAKVNPDLDGIACALAYADFLRKKGRSAEALIFGSPQSEVKYFIEKQHIEIPTFVNKLSGKWNKFILVDASSMKGMPDVVSADEVIEVIDHRVGEAEKEFPSAKIQNEMVGAAATLVIERFIKSHLTPEPSHALLLYGAIYHNTLNFIATNSTQRDHDASEYLETNFKLEKKLIREMFDYATYEVEKDVKTALENDAKEFGPGWEIGAYQLIVWGKEVLAQRKIIEEAVKALMKKSGSLWSFANIVDLKSKKSHIFVSNPEGRNILSKALDIHFTDNWAILNHALLRKQIMPKVNEVTKSEKN